MTSSLRFFSVPNLSVYYYTIAFVRNAFNGFFFRGYLSWENGAREGISRGRYPWSDRGATGPQPEGNGDCLAILNNVYNDRVKYHDVACHHTKPTICECP